MTIAIGERLSERSLSVRAAERIAGLPERRIRSVLEGKAPGLERAAEICEALDIEFYIGRPRDRSPHEIRPIGARVPSETSAYVSRVSEGIERRGARFSALGCAWFGAGVLTELDLDPEHCRAVESLDGSMAPTLPRKSVALADLRRTEIWDGGIFLIGPEDRPTLRRLVRHGSDWRMETDNPDWTSRPLKPADEIMGEALWRSMTLPTEPGGKMPAPRRDPAVDVTRIETEGLRPWAVPYRGRLQPDAPVEFEPEDVAWFEFNFLRILGIDPVNAETVTVDDVMMMPVLCPRAAVLVDRRRVERRDGAIYLMQTSEGMTLRCLLREGQLWRVATAGPTFVRPRPFGPTDRILGEALWTASFLPGGRRSPTPLNSTKEAAG